MSYEPLHGTEGADYDPTEGDTNDKEEVSRYERGGGAGEGEYDNAGGVGGAGAYEGDEGEEEEDDGFAVKLSTQALSSMPTTASTSTNIRGARTAPQAMKSFSASGHGGAVGGAGAVGSGSAASAKTTASLAPLTTLGGSNRVSIPANPAINSLLGQSDESRFRAHLEASAMENYPDKPWNREGADPSDYFNYGFTEASWTLYREKQLALRQENGSSLTSSSASTQLKPERTPTHRSSRMDTSSSSPAHHGASHDSRDSYSSHRDDSRRSTREDDRQRRDDYSDRSSHDRSSSRNSNDRSSDRNSDRYDDRRSSRQRDDRRRDYDDSSSYSRKRARSPDNRDARDDADRKKPARR